VLHGLKRGEVLMLVQIRCTDDPNDDNTVSESNSPFKAIFPSIAVCKNIPEFIESEREASDVDCKRTVNDTA
jgi:hypothetical protein